MVLLVSVGDSATTLSEDGYGVYLMVLVGFFLDVFRLVFRRRVLRTPRVLDFFLGFSRLRLVCLLVLAGIDDIISASFSDSRSFLLYPRCWRSVGLLKLYLHL